MEISDLEKLHNMLDHLLFNVEDDLGGEKVQPYICILKGVLKGISIDLKSDLNSN